MSFFFTMQQYTVGLTTLLLAVGIGALLLFSLGSNLADTCVQLWSSRCSKVPRFLDWDPFTGQAFRHAEREARTAGKLRSWYREVFSTYGSTFETCSWGQRIIHTMDTSVFRIVLLHKSECFGVWPTRGPTSVPWLGMGALVTDGQFWQMSRDLIKPIFAAPQVANLGRLEKHLFRMIDLLPSNGVTVDLQGLFARMYLDFSTDFLFGQSADTLDPSSPRLDAAKFLQAFDRSLAQVVQAQTTPKVLRWMSKATTSASDPFQESTQHFDKLIDGAIERHKDPVPETEREKDFVFLERLLSGTNTDDRDFIRGQILNVFYPARDTSAMGISLVMYQVARRPDVWLRIRDEIRQFDSLSDSVPRLEYTRAVVQEALRLFSSGSNPTRTALKACYLPTHAGRGYEEGLYIPRGTKIVMHAHAAHRDPDAWGPDADQFRPERWMEADTNIQRRREWDYLPFSGGPRICPAARMMETQYVFVVAFLAKHFAVLETRDAERELVEESGIGLKSRNGVQVALVRDHR